MSDKPPEYGYEYPSSLYPPPSKSAPSYTYVPTPVMMPMPMAVYPPYPPPAPPQNPEPVQPPQPTYVTNYIYQQPPQPDPVPVAEVIDWASATPATAARLTHKAFAAGKEGWDGSPLWVIRAYHNGDCVIGKYSVKNRCAYIPYGRKEIAVQEFEVLLTQPHAVRWVPSSNGQVPVGAIAAGSTQYGEPLYIARVKYLRSIIPGKVHPSHGCCYFSHSGSESPRKHYEVLCNILD